MNVVRSSTASASSVAEPSSASARHQLNWYDHTPQLELSLDDFEVYALKRLKVLRKIEQLKMMRGISADQSRAKLDQWIQQEDLDDPLIDEASHFILRLSYSQSEELRRWFLQMESALFLHRLQHSQSQKQLAESVASYAELSPITKAEKEQLREPLLQLLTPSEFATSHFYAVPFTQALDLVATRQCYVHSGKAYIPQAKVYSILMHKFRMHLSRSLACMASAGALSSVQDAEQARIFPLLSNLNRCLVHTEPSADASQLTAGSQLRAGNVQDYVPHMPLCMQQVHRGMKADGKLRHWGRLQYGLFLKGAGLSMEDAMLFFQRHFTAVTGEVFQKQYAYNIRHMYGKEGKRASYTPYPCTKIILGNAPAANADHHGCPYKHYDTEQVGRLLQKLSVGTASDRSAILQLQKNKQYQLACAKHFEVTHPGAAHGPDAVSLDGVGNHPNAWFRASVLYSEQQNGGGGDDTTPSTGLVDASGNVAGPAEAAQEVSP